MYPSSWLVVAHVPNVGVDVARQQRTRIASSISGAALSPYREELQQGGTGRRVNHNLICITNINQEHSIAYNVRGTFGIHQTCQ